jgi:hypothetical protein
VIIRSVSVGEITIALVITLMAAWSVAIGVLLLWGTRKTENLQAGDRLFLLLKSGGSILLGAGLGVSLLSLRGDLGAAFVLPIFIASVGLMISAQIVRRRA